MTVCGVGLRRILKFGDARYSEECLQSNIRLANFDLVRDSVVALVGLDSCRRDRRAGIRRHTSARVARLSRRKAAAHSSHRVLGVDKIPIRIYDSCDDRSTLTDLRAGVTGKAIVGHPLPARLLPTVKLVTDRKSTRLNSSH